MADAYLFTPVRDKEKEEWRMKNVKGLFDAFKGLFDAFKGL